MDTPFDRQHTYLCNCKSPSTGAPSENRLKSSREKERARDRKRERARASVGEIKREDRMRSGMREDR